VARKSEEKEALRLVQERFRLMRNFRQGYEADWNKFYKQYKAITRSWRTDKEGRRLSNLFIPKTFVHIETEMSQLMDAFFSSRPVFTVQPREANDIPKAKMAEALLDYQIFAIPHFALKFSNFLRDALIYGTGLGMTTWRYERDSTGVTTYDNPDFTPIDIFDWWADPMAVTLDKAEDVVRRVVLTRAEIERFLSIGWLTNSTNVKKMLKEKEAEMEEGRKERLASSDVSVPEEAYQDRYELLEYWTGDKLIVTDGRNPRWVLRNGENPYGHMPFVMVSWL